MSSDFLCLPKEAQEKVGYKIEICVQVGRALSFITASRIRHPHAIASINPHSHTVCGRNMQQRY